MSPREADPALRRIERNALVACLLFALIALVGSGGRVDAPLAVLAGGALIGVSYWAIKAGVDGLASALAPAVPGGSVARFSRRRTITRAAAKFLGRYALLGVMAYVMIARLRMHPIGLLVGVSSVVAAAAIEAIRILTGSGPSRDGLGHGHR